MSIVDIKKAFNRVPRKVMQWTVKKQLSDCRIVTEVIVKAVMSFYHKAKTKVRGGQLSKILQKL